MIRYQLPADLTKDTEASRDFARLVVSRWNQILDKELHLEQDYHAAKAFQIVLESFLEPVISTFEGCLGYMRFWEPNERTCHGWLYTFHKTLRQADVIYSSEIRYKGKQLDERLSIDMIMWHLLNNGSILYTSFSRAVSEVLLDLHRSVIAIDDATVELARS